MLFLLFPTYIGPPLRITSTMPPRMLKKAFEIASFVHREENNGKKVRTPIFDCGQLDKDDDDPTMRYYGMVVNSYESREHVMTE